MATIKLAVLKHTKAKDGSFKVRIAVGHKSETHYIVTRYRVATFANFRNGMVVGQPDANYLNVKLRSLLNDYDSRLDRIPYRRRRPSSRDEGEARGCSRAAAPVCGFSIGTTRGQ